MNANFIRLFFISIVLWLCACDKQNVPSSNCPLGYEGEFCDSLSALKFIGSYRVSESCTTTLGGPPGNQFSSAISQGFQDHIITISNFANTGLPIDVEIYEGSVFTIPSQKVGGVDVSGGRGRYQLYPRQIILEYNYTISGNFRMCDAVYTRF